MGNLQSLAGGTWVWDLGCLGLGHGVTEPASQLPILLVTLENIPERFQGVWGEEVDAAVDDVTDEGAGFLHIVQDLRQGRHSSQWGGPPHHHLTLHQPRPPLLPRGAPERGSSHPGPTWLHIPRGLTSVPSSLTTGIPRK